MEAWDFSSIQVDYTSTPLKLDVGGISVIDLLGQSTLNHNGGETGILYLWNDARAELRGGSINTMRSYQDVSWWYGKPADQHITMYVSEYNYNTSTKKLTGLWWDESAFSIQLYDNAGYDRTIDNIAFVIPEPATIILCGLGGVLLRRRAIR